MRSAPSKTVLRVVLPVPLRQVFDYLPLESEPCPRPGMRVLVTFSHRQLVGVIVEIAASSELPTAKLARVLDFPDGQQVVLSSETLTLLKWCWKYYQHSPGEVVFNALPPLLRRPNGKLPPPQVQYCLTDAGKARLQHAPGRQKAQFRLLGVMRDGVATEPMLRAVSPGWRKTLARLLEQQWIKVESLQAARLKLVSGPRLNDEQQAAVAAISSKLDCFQCHLLDGITGSGKTEVYLCVLEQVLSAGGQVLLLVPEIGLTPQLIKRFKHRLGFEPVVSHSGLSEGQRLKAWAMAKSGQARLVIGTRSALFLPISELQIIILDEEHDASFKQQDGFRYSTRDVAVKRAAGLGIPVVLGTATPSLETFNNALAGRYNWHRLTQRATGAAEPHWRVLDLRQQTLCGGISVAAMEAIEKTLESGCQALIFLNRRGYAPVILCHTCGWHAACQHCDANLTWHKARHQLLCHHCESSARVPVMCPACGADALRGAGEGTEQLQQVLVKAFPTTPLLRFDRDTVRKRGEFERLSETVKAGEPCLLVGTQMLAKGHHFPKVTLVVIINLDQALYSADFRALERMGQLMIQVAGRAGRDKLSGEVILQTHYPEHESLKLLLTSGYSSFVEALRLERKTACLPPFSYQALLRSDAQDKEDVKVFLNRAKHCFPTGQAMIYGPFPAMMERRSGRFRWYLLVQAKTRPALHLQLHGWILRVTKIPVTRRLRWAVDVDPQDY